jgi:WD40 repeat protein
VRALDVNKGVSWAWLRVRPGRDAGVSALDLLAGLTPASGGAGVACTAVVGLYDGGLGLLDPRAGAGLTHVVAEAHGRKVTSVSAAGAHHFTSSSSDSFVHVWDARAMKKPLASVRSEQAVTSNFLSPLATRGVSTCNDNKLRVWALDWAAPRPVVTQTAAIAHNNHTGRWLSAIRAVFDPADEDVFVAGSMEREVEVFSAVTGERLAALTSEWLTAVPTLNAVHPTRRLILSGTASGRLHIWS